VEKKNHQFSAQNYIYINTKSNRQNLSTHKARKNITKSKGHRKKISQKDHRAIFKLSQMVQINYGCYTNVFSKTFLRFF